MTYEIIKVSIFYSYHSSQLPSYISKILAYAATIDRLERLIRVVLVLLARIASNNMGRIDWAPFMPQIMTLFVQV